MLGTQEPDFLARLDKVQEELLYYPRHRRWRRRSQNVKVFTLKFFYVMGKALSGELSCPCDRSCLGLLLCLCLLGHIDNTNTNKNNNFKLLWSGRVNEPSGFKPLKFYYIL